MLQTLFVINFRFNFRRLPFGIPRAGPITDNKSAEVLLGVPTVPWEY